MKTRTDPKCRLYSNRKIATRWRLSSSAVSCSGETMARKKLVELFEEMKDLEYNIAHPHFEIIHPYYQNGYLECLNKIFDILELGDDVKGIDPEYIFGCKDNEVLQPRE